MPAASAAVTHQFDGRRNAKLAEKGLGRNRSGLQRRGGQS
jgi:hypothetical protein